MRLLFLLVPAVALSFSAQAADTATVTQIEGQVRLFYNGSRKLVEEGPVGASHVLFGGTYYLTKPAAVGDPIASGDIVQAAPGAKARLIFGNGDQFVVGSGTAMRVAAEGGVLKQVQLDYGNFRGVIEKGGPRKGLMIRTRTAVMGVRGTDFWISSGTASEPAEVQVFRGKVAVASLADARRTQEVPAGTAARVPVSAPVATRVIGAPEIARVAATTRFVAPAASAPVVDGPIRALEQKAIEVSLKDIRQADPTYYDTLWAQAPASIESLDAAVVEHAPQAASSGAGAGKAAPERKDEGAEPDVKNVE